MKTTDEIVKDMEETAAYHEREAAKLRAMIAAAKYVPMPYPVPNVAPIIWPHPDTTPPIVPSWITPATTSPRIPQIRLGEPIWMVDPMGIQITCGTWDVHGMGVTIGGDGRLPVSDIRCGVTH